MNQRLFCKFSRKFNTNFPLKNPIKGTQIFLNKRKPTGFHLSVTKGQLKTPSATVELRFEVGDSLIKDWLTVMTNLISPLIGLPFLQIINTILDKCRGVLNCLFFSMQLKHADNTYFDNKEPLLNPTDILIQPGKQTVIYKKSQDRTDNEVPGIIQPSPDLENHDYLSNCEGITTSQKKNLQSSSTTVWNIDIRWNKDATLMMLLKT